MTLNTHLPKHKRNYEDFVEKFTPKLTTDDCYTPPETYDTILQWVREEYDLSPATPILRPFFPGGDFENETYPENCVVVDNPPFSILSKIVRWYTARGIRFFLFAPYLTVFSPAKDCDGLTRIVAGINITYENGAVINTAFITNLSPEIMARTAPELYRRVKAVEEARRATQTKEFPKYAYPDAVITAPNFQTMSRAGIPFEVKRGEGVLVSSLDCQRAKKKAIFGSGFLITEAKAKEAKAKKEAIVWELSERERALIQMLGKGRENP
ncbi:MAG: chromosome partitioning protein ParB [Bacteroidales bacterium]|nr:chromosome partitioning protein ParB [Bacteroidales bacterium]